MKQTCILCYYSQRLNYSYTHTHGIVIWSAERNAKPDIHKNNKGGTGEKAHGRVQDVKEKTRNWGKKEREDKKKHWLKVMQG